MGDSTARFITNGSLAAVSSPPARRPTIGVVLISHNEEIDLPGCLDGLRWVDEIVLVDDGSSDRTVEIAEARGCKVIRRKRAAHEYYSHQRNAGIEAATSDWLLHMDVDERVTPALASEILSAIRSNEFDGYRLRRLNYFLHRPMQGDAWHWNLVHLARRELFRFGGKHHETCLLNSDRVGQINSVIHHLNDASVRERHRKSGVYSAVTAEEIAEKRKVRLYEVVTAPIVAAAKYYTVQRGLRDGVPGFLYGLHTAAATFYVRAMAWDIQNRISRNELEAQMREQWAQSDLPTSATAKE